MLDPLGFFLHHLVLDLLLGPQLLLHQLALLLLLGLALLAAYHLLERVVLEGLLVAHHVHEVLLLLLLVLDLVRLLPHLVLDVAALHIEGALLLLLHLEVDLLAEGLLILLLPLDGVTLRLLLHVALSRHQDVPRAFLGLIELLPRLEYK